MKKALFATGLVFSCGFLLAAQGCSSGKNAGDEGGACLANNMCNGMLTCVAGVCVNTSADASMMDNTTGMDSPMDVKKDNNPGMDVMMNMCPTPAKLMNFMPPAYAPPRAPQNGCMQADIQGYWDNCRGNNATAGMCTTWKSGHMSCASCIESKRTDSSWGPLILDNGITFVNISGCIDLNGDPACGKADENVSWCDAAACNMVCPVSDFFAPDHKATLMDWQKCSQLAEMGDCASFVTTFQNTCKADAGAWQACTGFMDFQSGYFLIAPKFCSGGG